MPSVPLTFSWAALWSLLLSLAASGATFAWLCRRWTTDRPRSALADWARARRFRVDRPPVAQLPAGLTALLAADPRVELALLRGPVAVVRLSTAARPGGPRPTWNLLVRSTPANPGTDLSGLRPAAAAHGASILDLLPSLGGYPSLLPPERFVACATSAAAARRIANSPARGLLPHDVGLLWQPTAVVLDFSGRPFDGVEVDRMLAIAEQVVGHLRVG
jgi:hypothetical protein